MHAVLNVLESVKTLAQIFLRHVTVFKSFTLIQQFKNTCKISMC